MRHDGAMVTIQAIYEGELSCVATHTPSSSTLRTDAPLDNQGLARTFSPTDLMATALATCTLTIMGIVARREGLAIEGTRVRVEKSMSTDAPRRIAALPVHIDVVGTLTPAQRKKLEAGARSCPVHRSLHPDIDAPITFAYEDGAA